MTRSYNSEKHAINWTVIESAVAQDDGIAALVLVDEVKKRFRHARATDDKLYFALLAFADELNVRNPFRNKEDFLLAYKRVENTPHAGWEAFMARALSSRKKPQVAQAFVENICANRLAARPKTVLVAEAEKFVPNLQTMIDGCIDSTFVLTTQNKVYARVLENVFETYDNVEVVASDIYHYDFTDSRFDLILACPNFGGRMLSKDTSFMCREFEMVALENLLLHLNDGGRLAILLPGRVAFASGKVGDFRQFVQSTYTIKELSELPEGILSYCGLKVYLLDIANNRPNDDTDIVVRRYTSSKEPRRGSVTSLEMAADAVVALSELEGQGNWNIEQIFAQQDEAYQNYKRSDLRKATLGNVAEIFRGRAITKKASFGNIRVVNISNIGDDEIDYARLEYLQEEERKVANYLLQEGDVLLSARGTVMRSAVFQDRGYPCIASSNLIVIRPDAKRLDSTYLKIFLDSPIGNTLISSAQQGTIVINISYRDLSGLEIPVPPLETQKAVAKEYLEELALYKKNTAAAANRWAAVRARLQTF